MFILMLIPFFAALITFVGQKIINMVIMKLFVQNKSTILNKVFNFQFTAAEVSQLKEKWVRASSQEVQQAHNADIIQQLGGAEAAPILSEFVLNEVSNLPDEVYMDAVGGYVKGQMKRFELMAALLGFLVGVMCIILIFVFYYIYK